MNARLLFKTRKYLSVTLRTLTLIALVINAMAIPLPFAQAQSGEIELFASGLWGPFGMAFDASGNLFVANEGDGGGGDRVDVIAPDGTVAIFASGFLGVSGAVFNSLGELFVSDDTDRIFKIDGYESYTVFIDETIGLQNPNAIAFDSADNLYAVSAGGFVSKFDPTGAVIELNFATGLDTPEAIVMDEANNRFFVSDMSGDVYSVDLSSGAMSLYASTGAWTDGGLAMDAGGNLFYSAMNKNQVLKIDAGDQSVSACLYDISQPRGLTFDASGWLYVTSYDTGTIYRADGCMPHPPYYPHIVAFIATNHVVGFQWTLGDTVTLTIDNPGTLNSSDYSAVAVVVEDPEGGTNVKWWLGDDYQMQAGDHVMLTNGTITREIIVSPLTLGGGDAVTNRVWGTTNAGGEIAVVLRQDRSVFRRVIADQNGNWLADFSVPGSNPGEENPYEFQPGDEMMIFQEYEHQSEEYQGKTIVGWIVPEPLSPDITAAPSNDWISGEEWPINAIITIEIDNPNTPETPDFTTTQIATEDGWWPHQRGGNFQYWSEYDFSPGDTITLSDGVTTKSLIVSDNQITTLDVDTNVIAGTTSPNRNMWVFVHGENGVMRETHSDSSGNWSVDFTGEYDLQSGTDGSIKVFDIDEDMTHYDWRIPNPSFSVRANDDRIEGWEWTLGATVTIEIDDPATLKNPDFLDTATVGAADWDPNQTWFNVEFRGVYDIKPGDVVTVTDGSIMKQHTVLNLTFTDIDLDADIVYGIGVPNSPVEVWTACNDFGCIHREVFADQDGNWSANFAVPGSGHRGQETADLRPGSWIDSSQYDEDGDSTMYGYSIPSPAFSARLTDNEIHGHEWTYGASVSLTIDDPDTLQSPDYTKTEIVTFSDWDPNQTFVQFRLWEDGFTLQPGMFITMTDGTITKTHTVTNPAMLGVDADTDTVWGTGTPGAWVEVGYLCDDEGCAIRRTTVAADGSWLVDFSVPGGSEPEEQKTFDIQSWQSVEVWQIDEDGDNTQNGWFPSLIVFEQYTFNFNNPLLNGLAIRRAIALGTDRQRILDEAFLPAEEYGQLLNTPLLPGHPYQAPASELTIYPYSPDEARTLLTTAGWVDTDDDGIREKDGQQLAFIFKTSLNPMRVIAAQIFRENMAAIGIDITVVHDPNFFGEDGALVNGDFDIAEFGWADILEGWLASFGMFEIYHTDAEDNRGSYTNPQFDAALGDFASAGDEEARLSAALIVQQIFTADLPAFYLFTRDPIIPLQTPTGTSITLTPLPEVTITYTNVSGEGVTAALAVNFNPADLPQNMQLVGSPYEIGTTAMFETVQVCLAYQDNWLSPEQETALRLYHYHNGTWLDVTDAGYPDTVNNLICGTATDFSMFAILLPLNQPPQIESVTAPIDPVRLGQTITAIATFNDPNADDTHTALFEWGDGTTTTLPATLPTASAFHNYALPGVYTVTVTITDAAGESDTETFQFVVIYDPEGGFVTGGGWIWSPEGTYTPDPTLTGKATFGFVSKYQKGANVPTGNTEFQFKVADLNFKSTSYQWLVIAGSKAQFKGVGTINGAGEYGFMLTATDGSPDKFRIKIWDKATDEVIYDNQLGAADDANPTTAIQGGSIVIHTSK
jgi:hypothetical protein